MPLPESEATSDAGAQPARFVQRHFLWLLLGCYALAAVWPSPGLQLRNWSWPLGINDGRVTVPLALLALMLFCAAVMTDLSQIRTVLRHPLLLAVSLAAVWAGPAMLVLAAGEIVPWLVDGDATAGLLVGLALIAAMPVANSSVGWTQNSQGNLALSLALVVLSISASPWATPQLLEWLGRSLSEAEQRSCDELLTQFSGWFFVVWVILPTALGFACRLCLTPARVKSHGGRIILASAIALLLLNYINSALALPKAAQSSVAVLVVTAALAVALSLVGLALAWLISRLLRLSHAATSALLFGLSMKHTGLALILAGAVLSDKPLAILLIVLATLAQHLSAAVVQWLHFHRGLKSKFARH
jgi:BASS family bile acid:Na+ symporter